jgi:hypothetical protein
MLKRTIPLLALAAIALPVAAGAKQIDVTGPANYAGKGAVHGRLASADGPKRTRFRFAGTLTFTGALDMKVACRGDGQTLSSVEDGNLVVKCQGRMLAVAGASALGFSGQGAPVRDSRAGRDERLDRGSPDPAGSASRRAPC